MACPLLCFIHEDFKKERIISLPSTSVQPDVYLRHSVVASVLCSLFFIIARVFVTVTARPFQTCHLSPSSLEDLHVLPSKIVLSLLIFLTFPLESQSQNVCFRGNPNGDNTAGS